MTDPKTPPWPRIAALLCISVLVLVVADSTARQGIPGAAFWHKGPSETPATEPVAPTIVRPESIAVPILVYHNVRPRTEAPVNVDEVYDMTPEEFEAHLAYLRDNGYTAVTQRDLAAMLDGMLTVPAKPVLLGFDDGRATQITYVVPLLEKYGLVATFYVFTNAIGRPGYVTWDDLARLENDGDEVASHTVFHPFLTKITDVAELEREIGGSKRTLDARLQHPAVSLAYPFGLSNELAVATVKAAGYTSARGLRHTLVQTDALRDDLGGFIVTGPMPQFLGVLGGTK
jgi:peptidoglycan/xylan/chitin deacetylase (PgdA/CDA1 family)